MKKLAAFFLSLSLYRLDDGILSHWLLRRRSISAAASAGGDGEYRCLEVGISAEGAKIE